MQEKTQQTFLHRVYFILALKDAGIQDQFQSSKPINILNVWKQYLDVVIFKDTTHDL